MIDFVIMPSAPNEAPITELFAFLSIDKTGEGIVATILPRLGSTQLITSKERIAISMKKMAQDIASKTGRKVRLVRFTRVSEIMWESD